MRKFILQFSFVVLSLFMVLNTVHAEDIPLDTDQLQKDFACGAIGQKCCGDFRLPIITVPRLIQLPQLDNPIFDLPGLNAGKLAVELITNTLYGSMDAMAKLIVNPVNHSVNKVMSEVRGLNVCQEGIPTDNDHLDRCLCAAKDTIDVALLCHRIGSEKEQGLCVKCAEKGFWTAIGCVDYSLQGFFQDIIFGWGMGFAGVSVLACIIWSAFSLQISQGDPAKVKKSQEMLTACISGLILIIFSVFILRFIGVNVLRIPGFS